jgi:hypothetical protein
MTDQRVVVSRLSPGDEPMLAGEDRRNLNVEHA